MVVKISIFKGTLVERSPKEKAVTERSVAYNTVNKKTKAHLF